MKIKNIILGIIVIVICVLGLIVIIKFEQQDMIRRENNCLNAGGKIVRNGYGGFTNCIFE